MNFIFKFLKSSFLKEAFIYGLTGVISKFAPILIIPIYISYIGIEGFGVLDFYITIGLAIFIIFELQIVSGVMRSYYESQDKKDIHKLIGSAVTIYLVSFLSLLAVFSAMLLVGFESRLLSLKTLLPIILAVFPRQIFSLFSIILRMEHRAKEYFFVSISNVSLIGLFGIIFIYLFDATVESILYGMLFGHIIQSIFSLIRIKQITEFKLDTTYIKEISYYGAPIVITTLGGWLLASSGRVITANSATAFELGSYSLAVKVSLIYMVFLQAFRTAWDPYCMKKFGESDSKNIFAKTLNCYWVVGLVILASIFAISPFLMAILGATDDAINLPLLLLLLFGYYWQGAINIVAVGNSWARKTYLNSFGTIIGGTSSVFLSYTLIQNLGIKAGGIGYAIGMMTSFIIIYNLAQRNVYIPYSKRYIGLIFLSFLLSILTISFI